MAFVASLAWPASQSFSLGSLDLPPYRMLLLLAAVVVPLSLAAGRLKLTTADYLVGFFALGLAATILVNHGLFESFLTYSTQGAVSSIGYEAAASSVLETAGAYFLARATVARPRHFQAVMATFGWVTLFVCLFAALEAATGRNMFGIYQGSGVGEVRFGLHRAAGPFPHSILWGVFAAASFAYFAARTIQGRGALSPIFVLASLVGVATSVSTTAVLAVLIQAGALAWAYVAPVRHKWTALAFCLAVFFVFVELASPRGAVEALMSRMSFSQWNGYIRLIQWEHGWANVMGHPLTGLGFNDWARPEWLAASIDSYWLVLAVRHGLVVPLLLVASIVAMLARAGQASRRSDATPWRRTMIRVWAVTVVAIAVSGISVHFWAQSVVLLFFLMGCSESLFKAERRMVRA